jgi:hypothetical protein
MSRWRRVAACVAPLALGLGAQGVLAQSISMRVASLKGDSMPPGPVVVLSAVAGNTGSAQFSLTLEMSLEPTFQSSFYVSAGAGLDASFTTDSLLSEHERIYMRARLFDGGGGLLAEARESHPVRGWVTLIDPPQQSLVVLPTKKPRFTWASPPTTLTAGLWEYEVSVINKATGVRQFVSPLISDTTYVFPDSLESNASYRWQVRARSVGGRGSGEVIQVSVGTIVIGGDPTFTLLYQNFPNPFSRGQTTCFWFDLAKPSRVRLTIYDIRLRRVRVIVPGANVLPIGAYGRSEASVTGCDQNFTWNGKDENGRFVPAGVYIAEFRAGGSSTTRKILYKGP